MLDNQLIALIITTLTSQEAAAGIPGLPIAAAFQATQQGVNTVPTIYLYKVGDHRYGSPRRVNIWDEVHSVMVHTEIQKYETTFTLSALSTQNPATPSQYTASDIINKAAYILQSMATITDLQEQGVGIMRIPDVRNPYFLDDRARYEASPSFDFILTHNQTIGSTTPILESTTLQIVAV